MAGPTRRPSGKTGGRRGRLRDANERNACLGKTESPDQTVTHTMPISLLDGWKLPIVQKDETLVVPIALR